MWQALPEKMLSFEHMLQGFLSNHHTTLLELQALWAGYLKPLCALYLKGVKTFGYSHV